MKKFLCAVLAALLLFGCVAVAEEAAPVEAAPVEILPYDELTSITYQIPEGFAVEASGTTESAAFLCLVKDAFHMDLVIAHDEEYADLEKLNDLSEEELALYTSSLTEDWLNPQVYVAETSYGTKFVAIKEDEAAEIDLGLLMGVYQGFAISVSISYNDGTKLDASDFDAAFDFLSEVWFKDAE